MSAFYDEYQRRTREPSDIHQHLPELYATVARYATPRVLELGVRSGNSTAALLAGAEAVGGHVWSVDVAEPDVPAWWATSGRWTFIPGDDRDPVVRHRLHVDPGTFDVLFIDTSHLLEHTRDELHYYVPLLRAGGVALLHDTETETPQGTYSAPQPPYPVAVALDEYCAAVGLKWTNRTGCYGLGVLEIPT